MNPMTKKKEMRTSARKPIHFELMFSKKWSAGNLGEKAEWSGKTLDLCQNGLGFIADIPLRKGEILKVHLPVNTTGIPIPVFSEVRWARTEGKKHRVGLQFLS
jgi:hypothetical protein